MRNIVKFRTEIDVGPNYLNKEFFLKAELYFKPPKFGNLHRCLNSAKAMKAELELDQEPFKTV